MVDREELVLADLKAKYEAIPSTAQFDRLYEGDDQFGHMFSVLHKALNEHFTAINGRAQSTQHYWAEPSRDLIRLIKDLNEELYSLKRIGVEVSFDKSYQDALDRCEPWLSISGGSAVPNDFEQINIIKHEPVFRRELDSVRLKKKVESLKLSMIGEGSYANVYSYVDPDYGIKFAVKRAKRGVSDRDLIRFKQEFDVLKRLSFPYVVEVYRYDESRNEYKMEYCDETLRSYIDKRNGEITFATRKRIALQFLYGINYIHHENLLHRDVSLQNVLLKVFDGGAVIVKLSDFGLVKDQDSDFTRTQTEMRGTIRDPKLEHFKDYNVSHEIYAIGWVLSFIFSGKRALNPDGSSVDVQRIVQKCTDMDMSRRYGTVRELISDVEGLLGSPTTPADAPA